MIVEHAVAVWDHGQGTLTVESPDGSELLVTHHDRNELFLEELRHFLACVAGREQPVVGVHEGAASLRIALAAKRSLQTGAAAVP